MKRTVVLSSGLSVVAVFSVFLLGLNGQNLQRLADPLTGIRIGLDDLLQAHGASKSWAIVPQNIRITGSSTHDGITEPVTITATDKEELSIVYGSTETKKLVATLKSFFKDDGSKSVNQSTPAGFTQLDVTGLFMVEALKNRPLKVGLGIPVIPAGQRPVYRMHVVNESRSELHYLRLQVNDEADLLISDAGLLLGIERTFYSELPTFKTKLAYLFSDFRDTNGVLMPYQIEKRIGDGTAETIRVASYAFNVEIAPTSFEPRKVR